MIFSVSRQITEFYSIFTILENVMKKSLFILAILSILFLSGCSVLSSHYMQAKSMEVKGTGVLQIPVVADLNVSSTRISEEYTLTTALNMKTQGKVINEAKDYAVANAVQKYSADVLVEPIFEVYITKAKMNKSDVRVIVTGYPATYKNFRSATQGDMELIDGTRKPCEVKH